MKLATRIFMGLVLGIIVGLIFNLAIGAQTSLVKNLLTYLISPIGDAFIRAIRMIVVPLVFASIVVGTASLGDIRKVGRIGGKTIGFYLVTTAFAVILGLLLASVFTPGLGTTIKTEGATYTAAKAPPFMTTLINMIPNNPVDAFVRGDMLQIIVFAILIGIAISLVGEPAKALLKGITGLNEVMMRLTMFVMEAAPYAVFCLITRTVTNQGTAILLPMAKYILIIYLGLLIHAIFVYGGIVKVFGKVNPIDFFKRISPAMLLAFSSASSAATLPLTIECGEKNLGIKREVCAFTLPLGATINMDGTALYQGISALFLAQLLGVNLTVAQMATIVLSATLASIGTAGVPGAGMIMLAMVLESVGLPVSAIGIIMGVDRLIDMGRTTMNVTGDLACTLAIARSENALDYPTTIELQSRGISA
ncbi:MAG: dicarboxylate/amino acid:cation symporter [Bacillota bacterium]|nr:dicarboxylate/amino acid:cation symporter [Bacillota bacterium]